MTDHAEPTPGFGPEWSASRRRAPEADLRAWLELGLSVCDAADEIALRWFRRDVPTSTKPDRSFVTEADQAIERLVRERIRATHPDHGLVGEEYGEGGQRRPDPLVHRPHRRDPQLHPRRAALRDAPRGGGG